MDIDQIISGLYGLTFAEVMATVRLMIDHLSSYFRCIKDSDAQILNVGRVQLERSLRAISGEPATNANLARRGVEYARVFIQGENPPKS
jgi:hypothetical protein